MLLRVKVYYFQHYMKYIRITVGGAHEQGQILKRAMGFGYIKKAEAVIKKPIKGVSFRLIPCFIRNHLSLSKMVFSFVFSNNALTLLNR
jgi:hypothetical protein